MSKKTNFQLNVSSIVSSMKLHWRCGCGWPYIDSC